MNTEKPKSEAIVKVIDLVKTFDEGQETEVQALQGISLDINHGEIVSIMGPSGSGKTTLLNCISGIDEATSGQIIIDGNDIQKMKDKEKTKYRAKRMGFIFQSFNLIPVLTALENVEIPLLIAGEKSHDAKEKATAMLEIVGLADRLTHKPNELSGGQRQRVTIARALVHQPAVVWADEPTGNLDRQKAFEIFDLILELNEKYNETFVMVTHDQELASKTQRIIEIESGKLK
ncbi:ABC transporter ATP-binding protein [Candidatus Dojkabacteria bacterium]|nr:ABC transporter ATP-binding protein [Candidatus Dojkabacteria bacterium]